MRRRYANKYSSGDVWSDEEKSIIKEIAGLYDLIHAFAKQRMQIIEEARNIKQEINKLKQQLIEKGRSKLAIQEYIKYYKN